MTTGGIALRVAGMAAITGDPRTAPVDLAVEAAVRALEDAQLSAGDVAAAIHVGVRGERAGAWREGSGAIASAVRHRLDADFRCPAFDLMDGACGVLSAMAVGASLTGDGRPVLVTTVDPVYADAAALVVSADGSPDPRLGRGALDSSAALTGARPGQPMVGVVPVEGPEAPILLPAGGYTASPVIGLLRGRANGFRDVLVVAVSGGEGVAPTASVRCRIA